MTALAPKTYDPAKIAKLAAAFYVRSLASDPSAFPLSPALATKTLAKKTGVPASRLVPLVAAVFYAENGSRSPIALPKTRTPRSVAVAVRKRRDAGGRLGRWEVVAASLSETLGRPVSVAAVRALYAKSGSDIEASYTGRGTRVGAPKTRTDETAELALAVETDAAPVE